MKSKTLNHPSLKVAISSLLKSKEAKKVAAVNSVDKFVLCFANTVMSFIIDAIDTNKTSDCNFFNTLSDECYHNGKNHDRYDSYIPYISPTITSVCETVYNQLHT